MNELELLRQVDPAPGPMPTEGRAELLANLQALPTEPRSAKRTAAIRAKPRRRRLWLPLAAGLAIVAGGATAYAASQLGRGDTAITNLQCETPNGDDLGQVKSGDPIADCAELWRRTTSGPVPALVAYVFNNVTYYVQPASWPVPTDPRFRRLSPTLSTDPALVELKVALQDRLAGPRADCLDTDQTRELISTILTRLNLATLPVELLEDHGKPRTADGNATCAEASLDSGSKHTRIALYSMQRSGELSRAHEAFLERLRRPTSCRSLSSASQSTNQAAREAGFSPDEVDITAVPDGTARCTRIYVEFGGKVLITMHGPGG